MIIYHVGQSGFLVVLLLAVPLTQRRVAFRPDLFRFGAPPQCFQPELPWAKCNQPWNTERCIEDTYRKNKSLWLAANASGLSNFTSPVTEFWE